MYPSATETITERAEMNEQREYQNELLAEVAYQLVRDSELFDVLSNAEVDATAEQLAAKLRSVADAWLVEQETAAALKEKVMA